MILIIDSTIERWSSFDSSSLKTLRQGAGLKRLPSEPEAVGLIVSGEGGENPLDQTLRRRFKDSSVVTISDSEFFKSLPTNSFSLLIPALGVRKTGRHGLIHADLLEQAGEAMGKSPLELNLITIYLDEESSVAAIRDGIAVDVSTSLPGAHSAGEVGTEAVLELVGKIGLKKARKLLTEESGLLGFAGMKGDLAGVTGKPKLRRNPKFLLGLRIFLQRLLEQIGAYQALLGRVDAVVFSGVLGEKSAVVRDELAASLGILKTGNVFTFTARPHLLAARLVRAQRTPPSSPHP